MYACMTVVSGLPMGRRRSRVAPKSGAHARVARLRQRLGGGDSRKTVGGGVSRRYLHPTHLQRSHLHAHSAHRTSRTRVTLVAPVEWRARGPAVKSQGDRREGAEAMAWQSQPSHRLRWHSSQRLHAGGGVTPRGSGARSRTGPDDAASAVRETARSDRTSRWSLRLICIARRPGARRRLRLVPPTLTICTEPLFSVL